MCSRVRVANYAVTNVYVRVYVLYMHAYIHVYISHIFSSI